MQALKKWVPTPLRRLAAWLLPLPSRRSSPNVFDVRSHAIREGIRLDVYWLGGAAGPGPCASLVVLGDEVLRLDCIGPGRGHMHINMKQTRGFHNGGLARLYYREQAIGEQIERACFELEHNLLYALQTNAAARVRRVRLTDAERATCLRFMRDEMQELLERHRAALPDSSAGA